MEIGDGGMNSITQLMHHLFVNENKISHSIFYMQPSCLTVMHKPEMYRMRTFFVSEMINAKQLVYIIIYLAVLYSMAYYLW
jgi:hypothetical protein